MPARLRLIDLRYSRLPTLLGICPDNTPELARYVNAAQEQLIYAPESGEEGWYGSFAEIAFTVSRSEPFITLDRDIARLEMINICDWVRPINNQYKEYLRFGNGRMPKECRQCDNWFLPEGFSRNNAVTFRDLTNGPQMIKIQSSSDIDADGVTRVFFQGLDQNNKPIYTQDGENQVQGVFVPIDTPFVFSPIEMNRITGIQKDETYGQVTISQVDPTSGEEIELLVMQPTEVVAGYRRYYFHNLPFSCCPGQVAGTCPPASPQPITLRAIAKLELIPVSKDTDYCLIQSKEALTEKANGVRYSEMDNAGAKAMSQNCHRKAIQMLNGELRHYFGVQNTAVGFAPFGSARLERQRIGTLI